MNTLLAAVLFAIVCFGVLALPFVLTTSATLQSISLGFQVSLGSLAYLIHARNWRFNTTYWAVLYVVAAILPVVWFCMTMSKLSPYKAKADRQTELEREQLLSDDWLNLKGGAALGCSAFLVVGATTLLAHEYARAFPSRQPFSRQSVNQLVQLARDFKWQVGTAISGFASATVVIILLVIPNELWWVRVGWAVGVVVVVLMTLHIPRYYYRRVASCTLMCLICTQFAVTFLAVTPDVSASASSSSRVNEDAESTDTSVFATATEGTLFIHVSQPGASFYATVGGIIIAAFAADLWLGQAQSPEKPSPDSEAATPDVSRDSLDSVD